MNVPFIFLSRYNFDNSLLTSQLMTNSSCTGDSTVCLTIGDSWMIVCLNHLFYLNASTVACNTHYRRNTNELFGEHVALDKNCIF